MKKLLQKTKRGGASMFVVMFTMIILSIIVLGFTRLILSEATKTSNTDLSQSAYDSALAGVEDAKMALLQYHACLDKGYRADDTVNSACKEIIKDMQDGIAKQDCSTVANVLNREYTTTGTENAVVVQETQKSSDAGNNTNMLQAYTCVTIKEDLEDYRTTLDSSSRLRIIPIRAANIDSVNHVRIKWFSQVNFNQLYKASGGAEGQRICGNDYMTRAGFNTLKLYPLGKCVDEHTHATGQQAPTTLAARLIQTDEWFDLSELSVARASDQTDTGQLYFVPTYSGGTNSIAASKWGESANKGENQPIRVNCGSAAWFCTVDIDLPKTFKGNNARSDANTYLLVSIPYGSPETDLSVMVYSYDDVNYCRSNPGDANRCVRQDFTGVQARIDSTGRANDLYRRVESRVELVDTYFAYPEFEITMRGGDTSHIKKTFDATFDCRYGDNGSISPCSWSDESEGYANF